MSHFTEINFNQQSPRAVVMVRPHHFRSNPETTSDNTFQVQQSELNQNETSIRALEEVTNAVSILRSHGVTVHLFEDIKKLTPDSVFPNNWFSTHADGSIGIYPMYFANRRKERKKEIIELLKSQYRVEKIIDYSHFENKNIFLEGTGSVVLDHINRIAYAVKSNRTSFEALTAFCSDFNYRPMFFEARDKSGTPIYHTNVFLSIAEKFALVGLDLIPDKAERQQVLNLLVSSGKEVIELSSNQIENFTANALELTSSQGKLLAISRTAFRALTQSQISTIEKYAKPVVIDIPTIESAGGSIRCMLAGIHLELR
ncbi:citrulline utilization hydrolase CtlX [Aliikangiella coralliicola]|uniref:Amidinotransferase n=1 Tax=Aliikangiella coralliicola TaxID=2592383 RepID=A0A545UEX7_9GAMM|nr:arginine deiminase-related protein [Aliikangiella coralliicola]TQV87943.1 amidinotransferase [Aliikangiella coralliicola]